MHATGQVQSFVAPRANVSCSRDAGKLRSEGKAYIVKDGDVLNFLFNA